MTRMAAVVLLVLLAGCERGWRNNGQTVRSDSSEQDQLADDSVMRDFKAQHYPETVE